MDRYGKSLSRMAFGAYTAGGGGALGAVLIQRHFPNSDVTPTETLVFVLRLHVWTERFLSSGRRTDSWPEKSHKSRNWSKEKKSQL